MPTKTLTHAEELAREHITYFNDRNLEEGSRHVTPDCEYLVVPFDKTYRGSKGYLDSCNLWINAFPDARADVLHVVGQGGSLAMLEFRGRGTHKGTLDGPNGKIAPTGKKVDLRFVEIYEFKGDKLSGGRLYFDAATMMRQLGLKP